MCGIAGWLGNLSDSATHAARMAQSMHHRGPDSHGTWSQSGATLVHTRLSIIDLSPAGAQPMPNLDRTVWVVFNGEIYNHRDLRHNLIQRGYRFRGRSDTEVLPYLYEEEGPDFVKRLRGMFALAIFDTKNKTLLLARDRFGIKPLFYAPTNHRLAFASEIRALLKLPKLDTRPDRQSLYDFAALFYIPAPATFYTGIRALQPGEILTAKLVDEVVSWKTRFFHRWEIAPDLGISLAQARDHADELVTTAVHRQLEADVPLGSMLSGGIDSSLVSVAAQRALSGSLRTFNVQFSERDYDETWAAVRVARQIGSQHNTLQMKENAGTWDNIATLLLQAGQPFADTSLFAVNTLCRLMRRHVTVAISGEGGDEAFGGYDIYWRLARIIRWQQLPQFFRSAANLASSPLSRYGVLSKRFGQRMQDLTSADDTCVIQSLFSVMSEPEHINFCNDTKLLPVRRLFEPHWERHLGRKASRLERLSAHATEVNTRLTLANDFLFKVDTASMRESLEVRVPMLDEDLFKFGLSLPHNLKVAGRTCKRTLRAVAARRLPPEVANKQKWGFSIPLDAWAKPEVKHHMKNTLLGRAAKLPEFYRPEAYEPIVKAFCDDRTAATTLRHELFPRVMMMFSVQLALDNSTQLAT